MAQRSKPTTHQISPMVRLPHQQLDDAILYIRAELVRKTEELLGADQIPHTNFRLELVKALKGIAKGSEQIFNPVVTKQALMQIRLNKVVRENTEQRVLDVECHEGAGHT